MLYRLPFLFSASYYVALLFVQILVLIFGQQYANYDIDFFYYISTMAMNDLTSFFFIFTLTCLFFYQNKLYFYTPKNKQSVIVFAVIFAIIYYVIEYLLGELVFRFLLPYFINASRLYNTYNEPHFYRMEYQLIMTVSSMWLFIIIGLLLYYLVKRCRRFFQTPLIDNMTQSYQSQLMDSNNQLNSNSNVAAHRSLYAIIFASIFCCTVNGIIWNIYFNLLSSIDGIAMMIDEYYYIIFCVAFISIVINYTFLVVISKKFIMRTYSWLPTSSLLTASAITLFLFGLCVLIISCFMLPLAFSSESIILFVVWFVLCYAILYFLTRFSLKRYFDFV